MGIFSFGKKDKTILLPLPPPSGEELISIAEKLATEGVGKAIENTIQKQIDDSYQYAVQMEQGDYFSSEFNINATSGRIKATYMKEPWIFATATVLAKALSAIPFKVYDKASGEEIKNHPLLQQINSQNKIEDNQTINWKGYLDFVLGGNYYRVFDEKYRESVQMPCELATVDVNTDDGSIKAYKFSSYGGKQKTIPPEQVVHFKFPNPYTPYYGMSLFTAASRPILLDRYKNEFEMAFYLRGATNAGVIETSEDINKTRMERLMRTFEAVYTGKSNWWRTMFLPKGSKWIPTGVKMSEMQHLEGLRENRLTILATLGIPPSIVGIVQDVNRSTSEIQDKIFWVNTIMPLAKFLAGSWNNSYLLKTVYKNQVMVKPDFSEIESLVVSLLTKNEVAIGMKDFFFIDEIRKKVYGEQPLPEGKGQIFVAQIASNQNSQFLSLGAGTSVVDKPIDNPVDDISLSQSALSLKNQIVSSQQQIEEKLSTRFIKEYNKYEDQLLKLVEYALRKNLNVQTLLENSEEQLAKDYSNNVEPILIGAMERGFSLASAQAKQLRDVINQKATFNATDQQAIDALREEQSKGQREQLIRRSIYNFSGFNKTATNRIMDIIAQGVQDGKTNDQIAAGIRDRYVEQYKNQSSTIARTEVLTATSRGLKWNHDVLKEVFTDVKKQWLTVGDYGSNPDARHEHVEFEDMGAVESNYRYGGTLEYPRDPNGSAGDVINCRCSLVSVIPKNAQSNADVILDRQ